MKICNIAMIGAGRIGKLHAENAHFCVPGMKLRAVADPFVDESWARELGVDLVTRDIEEVAKNPSIDAVMIATPSSMHVATVDRFIAAKKHVFCEKPVGFDPDEILRLTKAAKDAGVVFQVGFNRRFDANFKRIREAVMAGEIGTPQIVRITDRDPQAPALEYVKNCGGIYLDFVIHDFDTARYVTGSDAVEVYSVGNALIDPRLKDYGDIDTCITVLKMKNGALCTIDNSRQAIYGYDQRLEVFGSSGSIEADNNTPTNTILRNAHGMAREKPHHFFIQRYKDAYVDELKEFYGCVVEGKTPRCDGNDAAQAVRMARAAKESLLSNRPVAIN